MLVLVCLFLVPTGSLAQNEQEELYATAQRAFSDGFHDVAIRYLEEFIPKYPHSPKLDQARMLLGECYYFQNDTGKAMGLFKSLEHTTENKDALLFWMGETYLKVPDYAAARLSYQMLFTSFPDSVYLPQALYSLAWSHFDRKEYTEAGKIFLRLVTDFPKHQLSEDALQKIAESEYNTGDYAGAIRDFESYLARYPQSARGDQVQLNIADAAYYMEDYTLAILAYDKVLKNSSDVKLTQLAYSGKIWCAMKRKMYEYAQKLIREAMDFAKAKNLSSEDLLLAQGNLLYEKGEVNAAVTAYGNLISEFPDGLYRLEAHLGRANAYFALRDFPLAGDDFKYILDRQAKAETELVFKANLGSGWSQAKLGNLDQGISHFQAACEQAADEDSKAYALIQMGDAYQDTGKLDDAVRIYEQALRLYPASPSMDYVLYRMGMALLKLEKIELSLSALERLRLNFPQSAYLDDLNYFLGIIDFKKGNWVAAAERMERFLKALNRPSDFAPEANYILALAYLNLKKSEEALKIFLKILRLYPNHDSVAKNSDIGIAKCLFEQGQVDEAVKRFKLIVYKYAKTEVEREGLLWLAQYAMKNSQYELAAQYYSQIIDRFPNDPQMDQIHYEAGQAYEVQGQLDLALVHYKAVSDKAPGLSSKVKLAIAGIFAKEFDSSKALLAYQNIALGNPDFARDAYMKMAQLQRSTQNIEEEIGTYQKALKAPQGKTLTSDAELVFNIGDSYEARDNFEQAMDYYLKVPLLYPDQSVWMVKAYLRVAKIFEDRKDWDGANVTYQKVILLGTDESKYAQERLDLLKKNK